MSNKRQKFAVNVERRSWDVEQYRERAAEREAADEAKRAADLASTPATATQKAPLKARESALALESTIGQVHRFTASAPLQSRGGYHCAVCDCVLKDSATYLDHINGRKHQKKLGVSMKTERASVDDIKSKLAQLQSHSRIPNQANVNNRLIATAMVDVRSRQKPEPQQPAEHSTNGNIASADVATGDRGGQSTTAGLVSSVTVDAADAAADQNNTEAEDTHAEAALMASMGFAEFAAGKHR